MCPRSVGRGWNGYLNRKSVPGSGDPLARERDESDNNKFCIIYNRTKQKERKKKIMLQWSKVVRTVSLQWPKIKINAYQKAGPETCNPKVQHFGLHCVCVCVYALYSTFTEATAAPLEPLLRYEQKGSLLEERKWSPSYESILSGPFSITHSKNGPSLVLGLKLKLYPLVSPQRGQALIMEVAVPGLASDF